MTVKMTVGTHLTHVGAPAPVCPAADLAVAGTGHLTRPSLVDTPELGAPPVGDYLTAVVLAVDLPCLEPLAAVISRSQLTLLPGPCSPAEPLAGSGPGPGVGARGHLHQGLRVGAGLAPGPRNGQHCPVPAPERQSLMM